MRPADEIAEVNQAQRTYARLAGVLFFGAIILAIGGGVILSRIAGNGSFADTAARIAASERFYRVALSSVLIVTLSSILLAFALYVTLKPVNSLLAQLGMIFSLADSFLALIVRMCSSMFQYICFPPMALAEVVTGFYLVLFAVDTTRKTQASPASSALIA